MSDDSTRSSPGEGAASRFSSGHPAWIGRYRILGILGEGGMGIVYTAEQEHPHRRIALKVIRAGPTSIDRIRRFEREAEVLGRLQHPGIAQVYEAGTAETQEGRQPFFAMELVRGLPLTGFVHQAGLDLRQRLELFARLCDAAHYAHQRGVIHRDLKPANILVDESGQPKILDFGVARLTDADVQATRDTSPGEIVGTLQYMSPEQVNADPLDIDIRSDVYSLGVILYELVTGRPPYDLRSTSAFEAIRAILHDDPAPLGSIDRSLRGDVETITGKALEKEKARRYGSAMELASDVRRFLNDEPITARPASASYQLRKFARRNRVLVAGAVTAIVLLIAGTAVSTWQAVRASAAERLAESQRAEAVVAREQAESSRAEALRAQSLAERRQVEAETERAAAEAARALADAARADAIREQRAAVASAEHARREASKAQAVSGFLQEMLTSADPGNTRGRDPTLREVLDAAAERAEAGSLQREPEVNAAVHAAIAQTYYSLGDYAKALLHADSAYDISHRIFGPTSLAVAEAANWQGNALRGMGDLERAEQKTEEALAGFRGHHPPDHDAIVESLHHLAHRRYEQGRTRESETLHREALALRRRHHTTPNTAVARSLRSLASFLNHDDRPAEAEPLLVEALEILRAGRGEELDPDVVRVSAALADAKRRRGDLAGAETASLETVSFARRLYGDEHPSVADALVRLGEALERQRKREAAEPVFREALAMRRKLLGDEHPDVQYTRTSLGRGLMQAGRYDEAESLFTQALAGRIAVLGETNPAAASSLLDLGQLAQARGDVVEAERYFRQAVPIWREGKIAFMEAHNTRLLGAVLTQQGRFEEAEQLLQDALRQERALRGEVNFEVGRVLGLLAELEKARGDGARAETLFRETLAVQRQVSGQQGGVWVADALRGVASAREIQGDTASAEPYVREALEITREFRPAGDADIVSDQLWLGTILCSAERAPDGEAELRAAAQALGDGAATLRFRIQSALGDCLRRQERYSEAEPLLLAAQEGLDADPRAGSGPKTQTMERLVLLYEAWAKPERLAFWRARLNDASR